MRKVLKASLLLTLLSSPALADAVKLGEGAFMARCYAHLTGRKIPATHPLLINSIQANDHDTTIANCMQIFDKGRLVPSQLGPVATGYPTISPLVNATDLESLQVLNQFYGYYGNFFEESDFSNRPQTYSYFAEEQWDPAEDIMFYVRATFEGTLPTDAEGRYGGSQPFASVLRSNQSLSGQRILPQKYVRMSTLCTGSITTGCIHTPTALHYTINLRDWFNLPSYNDQAGLGTAGGIGYLTGVKIWPSDSYLMYGIDGTAYDPNARSGRNHIRTHGAGLLGTSSYILKNAQYADVRSGSGTSLSWRSGQDGGIKNRRRMIKNLFEGALCRSQPPLRMDDDVVLQRVKNYNDQNYAKDKVIPFRESQLCASCHVAYDEAAAVLRNTGVAVGVGEWDMNGDGGGSDANTFVFSHNITGTAVAPAPHLTHPWNNNTWANTKPVGALHFRDFRGNYVFVDLPAAKSGPLPQDRGIQELGEAITATDQFYACFAKRMFFFFTGIDVSLEDHGDARLEPMPATEKHYLDNFIVPLALGANGQDGLKQHQSVRRLIQDIISLDVYSNDNLRDYHD